MLQRLRVQQYRCFEDLVLHFPAQQDGGWTILVGENGTGKTSLLQAIVLGLMDPRPLTSLDNTPWRMCRQNPAGQSAARVSVDLGIDDRVVKLEKSVDSRLGAYIEDKGEPLEESPLVLGFSARRRIARPGELPESDNREVERVRGLFDPNLPLLAHDAFTVLPDNKARRKFAEVARNVITYQLAGTGDDSAQRMFPLVDEVQLRGRSGVVRNQQLLEQDRFVLRYGADYQARVAVEELSDGYQAMLPIVLEILVQATLETKQVPDPASLRAIVLIDDLEAHLHPRWQRTVVPLLREKFPSCQFVVTTHSPLVAASADPGEVQVLEVAAAGDVRVQVLEERLSALDADEIYETVFGVPRTASPQYVEQERHYLQARSDDDVHVDPEVEQMLEAAWRDRRTLTGRS